MSKRMIRIGLCALAMVAFALLEPSLVSWWLAGIGMVGTIVAGIGNNYAIANLNQDLGSGTPATWYAALLTAMPSDGDGTGLVEATWSGYARIAITNNSSNFPTASVVSHIATLICQASINWGTVAGAGGTFQVVGLALYTTSSAGNMGRTAQFGTPGNPVSYALSNGSSIAVSGGNLIFQEY